MKIWIVDPKNKTIELWQNQKTQWQKIGSDNLQSQMLKNLVIKKEDIFFK